jgi:8-oxo-dGTP pyrophosphatase MutT (NUDIX family)
LLWRWLPIAFALADRLARLSQHTSADPPNSDLDPVLKWAAVALIVVPSPDAILLIRRSERLGDPWSGHIALPGGRQDPLDPDLLETVIRETREEVGIQLERGHLMGSLEAVVPLSPVLPPIAVRPFVFLLDRRPALALNSEVASATWVEIEHLLQPTTHHPVQLEVAGIPRWVQAYQLEHGVIWGLTERILTSLIDCIGA